MGSCFKMAATMYRGLSLAEKFLARRGAQVLGSQTGRSGPNQQVRNLNVHEHVSFGLLKKHGIPVPGFGVAHTPEEAVAIAEDLDSTDVVVKAQVLTGGRGRGTFKGGFKGGVKLVYNAEEAGKVAAGMLGDFLVTKQTGEKGIPCNKAMVCERKFPRREFYIAIMMERSFGGPVIIASSQGGMAIEDVAAETPEAIVKFPIDISVGMTDALAKDIATSIGLGTHLEETMKVLHNIYNCFINTDAAMIEINPYAEDTYGKLYALDAKMRFDDNAEFRQKDIFNERDWSQKDPKEVEASHHNLNYIALDGSIGCLVNGAGLAMATMDIIKLHGGSPANFLDVGGGATADQVKEAFKIITGDPKVNALLVNIFGGIMRCDVIAEGIIAAARELNLMTPIVVRLQGTNVDEAKVMIGSSGLKILPVDNLDEAARLSCKLSKIVAVARDAHLDVKFEMPI